MILLLRRRRLVTHVRPRARRAARGGDVHAAADDVHRAAVRASDGDDPRLRALVHDRAAIRALLPLAVAPALARDDELELGRAGRRVRGEDDEAFPVVAVAPLQRRARARIPRSERGGLAHDEEASSEPELRVDVERDADIRRRRRVVGRRRFWRSRRGARTRTMTRHGATTTRRIRFTASWGAFRASNRRRRSKRRRRRRARDGERPRERGAHRAGKKRRRRGSRRAAAEAAACGSAVVTVGAWPRA